MAESHSNNVGWLPGAVGYALFWLVFLGIIAAIGVGVLWVLASIF